VNRHPEGSEEASHMDCLWEHIEYEDPGMGQCLVCVTARRPVWLELREGESSR
jgi:hypothetical protein